MRQPPCVCVSLCLSSPLVTHTRWRDKGRSPIFNTVNSLDGQPYSHRRGLRALRNACIAPRKLDEYSVKNRDDLPLISLSHARPSGDLCVCPSLCVSGGGHSVIHTPKTPASPGPEKSVYSIQRIIFRHKNRPGDIM